VNDPVTHDTYSEVEGGADKYTELTADIDLAQWGTYAQGDDTEPERNWYSVYGDDADAETGAAQDDASEGGWVPVGKDGAKYSGHFDGRGYTISNLQINRPLVQVQGLFGSAGAVIISNLKLAGGSVTTGGNTGGFVGSATSTTVTNSSVTGLQLRGGWGTSLMIGNTSIAVVSSSHTSGAIDAHGGPAAGLVGYVGTGGQVTISNSYNTGAITSTSTASGLVGISYAAIIITNSYNTGAIHGNADSGGLVGYDYNSPITISDSYNTGAVQVKNGGAGGLIGRTSANTSSVTISDSYNTGVIIANASYSGGLIGYVETGLALTNSYNTGSVTGSYDIGGLVGGAYSSSNISNSYNTGTVHGSSNKVGGILGYANNNATITNTASLGEIVTGTYSPPYLSVHRVMGMQSNGSPTLSNNYALATMTDGTHPSGLTHDEACGSGTGKTISDAGNLFDDNYTDTPLSTSFNGADITWAELQNPNFWTTTTNWDPTIWTFAEGKLPTLKDTPAAATQAGVPGDYLTSPRGYSHFAGTGTQEDPFRIETAKQLAQFACLVNDDDTNGIYSGSEKYTVLTADIDLAQWGTYAKGDDTEAERNWVSVYESATAADTATGAKEDDASEGGWVPIGVATTNRTYSGHFDGQGHTISNLKINRPDAEYQGLFGAAVTISITNLGVPECSVTGGLYTGGLVGAGGRYGQVNISNSYTTGKVSGTAGTGGLLGMAIETVIISNSYNMADVVGDEKTGGLVGSVTSTTTVTNSYNTGSVSGADDTAGLVGFAAGDTTIKNSMSLGATVQGSANVHSIAGASGNFISLNNYTYEGQTVQAGSNPLSYSTLAYSSGSNLDGTPESAASLVSPSFYSNTANWADISDADGTQTGWETSTWYTQRSWVPVLRGFGTPNLSAARALQPVPFLGSTADTIGTQDGNYAFAPPAFCPEPDTHWNGADCVPDGGDDTPVTPVTPSGGASAASAASAATGVNIANLILALLVMLMLSLMYRPFFVTRGSHTRHAR
jgi:hypothetical protein